MSMLEAVSLKCINSFCFVYKKGKLASKLHSSFYTFTNSN